MLTASEFVIILKAHHNELPIILFDKMMLLKIFLGIAIALIAYFAFLSFTTRHNPIRPDERSQLPPCPKKPNCVLSTSGNKTENTPPFKLI